MSGGGKKDQLQDVYFHLDGVNGGTSRIAWYGQLRAEEFSHAEALEMTIEKYRLTEQPWYQTRLQQKIERDARLKQPIDLSRRKS
jgi:hypothetical protein